MDKNNAIRTAIICMESVLGDLSKRCAYYWRSGDEETATGCERSMTKIRLAMAELKKELT